MATTLTDNQEETYQEFKDLVNMQPKEIEEWLDTSESKSVGHVRDGEDESVGRQSAKKIVEIKRTIKADLTDEQTDHMNSDAEQPRIGSAGYTRARTQCPRNGETSLS